MTEESLRKCPTRTIVDKMRGILRVIAAWCLVGALAEPRGSVMDGIYWCKTLCVCRVGTQMEVHCFQWRQLYDIMVSTREVQEDGWLLEGQGYWCNDLCLCNTNNDTQLKCVRKNALTQLVTDNIGDRYIHEPEEETEEEELAIGERLLEREEEREEAKYRKRSEKRKNRKNRKSKKNIRVKEDEEIVNPFVNGVSLITPPEPELTSEQALIPGSTTSSLPHHISHDQNEPMVKESAEMLLLKEEPVSMSPIVTTIQQTLPTTAASAVHTTHESTEESRNTPRAKVSPVREVPLERKTVASEVSQDLDELGSAVMQIKSDVILNQRILLVTVAVAGTAMLGVLVMAVHGCSSRRQALTNKKTDAAKDESHVTKVNLEEAW